MDSCELIPRVAAERAGRRELPDVAPPGPPVAVLGGPFQGMTLVQERESSDRLYAGQREQSANSHAQAAT